MAQRPYKLWNTRTSEVIPHRRYSSEFTAHRSALVIATVLRPGHTIELLNERDKVIASYTGSVGGVKFHGPLILNLREMRENAI